MTAGYELQPLFDAELRYTSTVIGLINAGAARGLGHVSSGSASHSLISTDS